jgi:hypothetical protein
VTDGAGQMRRQGRVTDHALPTGTWERPGRMRSAGRLVHLSNVAKWARMALSGVVDTTIGARMAESTTTRR